ncbi:hypothetical protein M378DRAFT_159999 [Amanita muscaria Koide BX008]|uniref:Uncharacterized protein n=1 Tax=Amanita muscaria (strain Koide BX008) TaxID=946122 RepID=A0A0C2SUH4_AMAMK|nr:hypothetical protein M378DRAFT_159999 [Amanita muscaria Koide BX008]
MLKAQGILKFDMRGWVENVYAASATISSRSEEAGMSIYLKRPPARIVADFNNVGPHTSSLGLFSTPLCAHPGLLVICKHWLF